MTEKMKKPGKSKAFWITATSVGVVGVLGLSALVAWPGVLKPALEEYQESQKLRYVDGIATTPGEIDPSVKITQNWFDGYTREFMKNFADTDEVGISVANDYYSDGTCYEEGKENCINPNIFYDYYTADMDKNRETVVDYFLTLGLTPTNYVPGIEETNKLVAEENAGLDPESEEFWNKKEAKEEELIKAVKNGDYTHLSNFSITTWCVTSEDQAKKLYGADYEEIIKLTAEKGYPLREGINPCLNPGISVLSLPKSISFTAPLGFLNEYSPASLPQIEGRNYTRAEADKATRSLNFNQYVCTDKPSLVHPYWLKWPDNEVKCVEPE